MFRFFPLRAIAGGAALAATLLGPACPARAVTLYGLDDTALRAAEWKSHTDRPFRLGEWEYVRLLRRTGAEAGAPNEHPYKMPSAHIEQLLQKFTIGPESRPAALFSESEVKQLAPVIAVALEEAAPDQDVVFLSRGRHQASGLFGLDLANAGRFYVAAGKLHLILGTQHSEALNRLRPGIPPLVPIDIGSRVKPSDKVSLAGGASVQLLRKDWAAVALGADAAPSESTKPARAIDVPAAPFVARPVEAPPALSGGSTASVESRLRLLQHLHTEKLISDAEYQQKRAEILKGL